MKNVAHIVAELKFDPLSDSMNKFNQPLIQSSFPGYY